MRRRTFLAAGVFGAAALATAGWLRGPHEPPGRTSRVTLDANGEAVLAAIAPVMLADAWPAGEDAHRTALDDTLAAADLAIGGLPPFAQAELAQMFSLLALPPVRLGYARIGSSWTEATPAAVRQFLDRLRNSRLDLPRSIYDGLHQILFAAWYGNPRAWDAIGYPGPPVLTAPAA